MTPRTPDTVLLLFAAHFEHSIVIVFSLKRTCPTRGLDNQDSWRPNRSRRWPFITRRSRMFETLRHEKWYPRRSKERCFNGLVALTNGRALEENQLHYCRPNDRFAFARRSAIGEALDELIHAIEASLSTIPVLATLMDNREARSSSSLTTSSKIKIKDQSSEFKGQNQRPKTKHKALNKQTVVPASSVAISDGLQFCRWPGNE